MKSIDFTTISAFKYDNDSYLIMEDKGNPWESKYSLKLFNNCNEILALSESENARYVAYIGKSDQLIILVRLDYIEDHSSVAVDFYEIKENKINKVITHVIDSGFTIGDTMIKVNKLNENKFIIMWSDLFNYDYLQIATVSKETYQVKSLTHELIHEGTFDLIYASDDNLINMVRVIGHDKNKITFLFDNIDHDENCIGGSLTCIEHNNDHMEFKSRIVDFMIYEHNQYILIKVNIEIRVDVLHLSKSESYILLQIDGDGIILRDIIEKSVFEPSIAIIDNKPKIFCSQIINKT